MEKSRQPSSPGISPVSISDSIEELLKFLLSASANETLEIDLGLSNAYCSYLLTPEPDHGSYHDAVDALQTSGGVPLYPLYKHLASTLHSCITSGAFWRTSNTITSIQEDECLKQKENEWSKLIASEGTELVKMLKVVDFELHVQEPFFTQLRVGLKTIEGRCAVGDYNRIGPGAFLLINKCLLLEVQNVKWYASFSEMMEAASLTRVLPGVETIEEGVQIYRKFYTEEKEKSNGVLAICVSRSAVQPYISMANIVHVEVKGSTLTDGARALAKHVNRSSDGWWGNFGGNVHWVSGAIHEGWPFKGMEALGICCTIFICEKHLMSRKDFLSKLYCVEEGDGPPVGPTIAWK
ncbi:uncharacterized protein LOC131240181 isoform X6 [Magnolia sinica]|uniref:uncharacterized protein LOC131240181 isoform X6 n=1 Tax=Magnolia sinica TaxID=86752 RepID=UPI00265A593A|nr:uncharacterized protein LOC131240181 isoform X6 [Magnolia sinica]